MQLSRSGTSANSDSDRPKKNLSSGNHSSEFPICLLREIPSQLSKASEKGFVRVWVGLGHALGPGKSRMHCDS